MLVGRRLTSSRLECVKCVILGSIHPRGGDSLRLTPHATLGALCVATLALVALPGASAAPFSEGPLIQVSGASPIPSACIGDANAPSTSINNYGTEVEPYVMVDPSDPNDLVGAWQQD